MQINDRREKIDAKNAGLAGSVFDDVNLSGAIFSNVNLTNARFDNINLSQVAISNANLHAMTIEGIAVEDLFAAYEARPK